LQRAIVDLSRDESEASERGKLLRCIIEKRFSNEVRMRVYLQD
jgi:hypothetical protein